MHELTVEGFPLSPQQSRIWSLQGEAQGAPYVARAVVHVEGELDRDALAGALADAISRHEILRTNFRSLPGRRQAVQVIAPDPRLLFEPDAPSDGAAPPPFDLERGPAARFSLSPAAPGGHLLLAEFPALCADSASLAIFVGELARCYEARLGGAPPGGAPLQYADLAEWQNELLAGEGAEAGRDFWRAQPLAALATARLPFESPRAGGGDFAPRTLSVALDPTQAARIEALAGRHETAAGAVLLACWQLLLRRLTGEAGLSVAAGSDGRKFRELQDAVGPLTKFVPVVCRYEEEASFGEVLRQTEAAARAAHRWQEYFSWEQADGADGAGVPFPPFAFEWEERAEKHAAGPVTFSALRRDVCAERFKAKLSCRRGAGVWGLDIHYCADALAPEGAGLLAECFQTLLEGALARPAAAVGELELLGGAARERLLVGFNRAGEAGEPGPCTHRLFERQAALGPDQVALVYEDHHLTYGAVNRRANQLARYLRRLGVAPEARVAVCAERSPEAIVGLLGVLKAGGAYVPMSPGQPRKWLAALAGEAGAGVVLSAGAGGAQAGDFPGARFIRLDADGELISRESGDDLAGGATADNLVYVLFTSGSTGLPKGVAVEHRQLNGYLSGVLERLDARAGDSYATVTTLAADLGHTMIFAALCTGGTLHLVAPERVISPTALADYFGRHAVAYLKLVPSHLGALLGAPGAAKLLPARRLVLGGEAAKWGLIDEVRRLAPGCAVLNHYGPTETTVGVLTHEVVPGSPSRGAVVPLGRPLPNARVYLLDERLRPVPEWVAGELCVAGGGLARGYLGRPDLTAERFLPDPFGGEPGARMYRTGDAARHLPEGELEFLGRLDHQVKIRGFRVEPGQVEAVLCQHPRVREAAVVCVAAGAGAAEQRLVAYFVGDDPAPRADELREHLLEHLPEYMTPAVFVCLKALPVTPNGKLDRRRLPAPEPAADERRPEYVAPRTPVEQVLAGLWADALQLERVGAHDDFFQLGGNSLLAIQVVTKIRQTFQTELLPRSLFESPTVAGLAGWLIRDEAQPGRAAAIARLRQSIAGLSADEVRARLGDGPR